MSTDPLDFLGDKEFWRNLFMLPFVPLVLFYSTLVILYGPSSEMYRECFFSEEVK